jgi:hypothetical protein
MSVARQRSFCATVWCLALIGVAEARSAQPSEPQFAVNYSRTSPSLPRTFSNAAKAYTDEEEVVPQFVTAPVPRNLIAIPSLRRMVESMLQTSPTFRRQCARLAAEQDLTVIVSVANLDDPRTYAAVTQFAVNPDGHLIARVQLAPSTQQQELLAHEFEHVLEQLDGVDLEAMSKRASTGVSLVANGPRFETVRAVAVGRQVAAEIRSARRRPE